MSTEQPSQSQNHDVPDDEEITAKENEDKIEDLETVNTYFLNVEHNDRSPYRRPTEQFIREVPENPGSCGLGPCHPKWMQTFANKQSFMIIFSILAVIQGMSWAYFTSTISTLEKRFKISSRTAGIVMTGNEISQTLFSIVIAYYGGRGHRPRWIAIGVLFSAFSCFVLASPHLIFGPGEDALSLTEEYHVQDTYQSETLVMKSIYYPSTTTIPDLDEMESSTNFFGIEKNVNESKILADDIPQPRVLPGTSNKRNRVQLCDRNSKPSRKDECNQGDLSVVPLILIFISQFVAGIGVLLFFSLGGPYLDDNVKKTQSPMLFGITMSLRLVGPTLGFLFGSLCLRIYISPSLTPMIKNNDPRWLGAWWLGWLVLGCLMMTTSVFIAMFPRELPSTAKERKEKLESSRNRQAQSNGLLKAGSQFLSTDELTAGDTTVPKLSEIPKAVKALLKNKVNLFNNLASVFYLFSAIGYWTYMPKYMETTFMQSAASAAAYSGIVSIAFQAIGLLGSGALISYFQPSARFLAGWNVVLGFLDVLIKIVFTQLGCNGGELVHGYENSFDDDGSNSGTWNLTIPCNVDCNCQTNKMLPVCYKEENKLFYSACHAGCTIMNTTDDTATSCSCLPAMTDIVTLGTCSEGCQTIFITFLAVNAVIKLLDSSGRIGNMLVGYRCVDPKDKALAIGLGIFLISIFSMLPSPIVFGAIIDSVCLVWGSKCGKKGNCWLYDGSKLRYAFNLTAAGFIFIGAFLDIFVWYYVKDLDLYDEEKNVQNRLMKKRKRQNRNEGATT